ncbi:MAG: hypothetical protein AAF616_02975 [Bacteroidota bacterium]
MNKLEKFRTMVRLALVDDQFETREKEYIQDLAKMHNVSHKDLDEIIQEELSKKGEFVPVLQNLDYDGKIEVLADLVRMMKVDGEVYLSEIKFCEAIARTLGFKQKSIGFLAENIHKDPSIAPNWMLIQNKMRKYVA